MLETFVLVVCVPIAVMLCVVQYKMKKAAPKIKRGLWEAAKFQVPTNNGGHAPLGVALFCSFLDALSKRR